MHLITLKIDCCTNVNTLWTEISLMRKSKQPFSINLRVTSHTIFFCTQYGDKKIKIYSNKKMTLFTHFFSCVNWKYLFLNNCVHWNLVWKDFKMSLQYFEEKKNFAILCAIKSCVTWAYVKKIRSHSNNKLHSKDD